MSDLVLSDDEKGPVALDVEYIGRRRALFSIAFRTLLLSLVTLGFYRFWMKARLRRYYWSATRIEGEPLEYVGSGFEKMIGFLIAVTFLAVYLGIAQVALSFAGIAVIEGGAGAINLAFVAVIPLYFYALYRARAYVLARTRWRGIRFALMEGAWGYAGRALLHSLLSIVSLGLLYPRQVFKLEKYLTDRTRYGDLKLRQDGGWGMLMVPWLVVWVPLAAILGGAAYLAWQVQTMAFDELVIDQAIDNDAGPAGILAAIFAVPTGLLLLYAMFATFRAVAVRRMAETKRAGETVRVISRIRWGKVLRIWLAGVIAVVIASLLPLLLIGGLISLTFVMPSGEAGVSVGDVMFDPNRVSELQIILGLVLSAATYMVFMFSVSVFWHLFITQPLWRHYAETLVVLGTDEIDAARQRSRSELVQAEGFADALDLGAAI